MDTYSDEEQIDRLKQWWQDNGVSLLTSIVIALAAILVGAVGKIISKPILMPLL